MTKYRLYVESGPRMKTTMVHVFDLLGCVANAKTTEDALGATDHEIREFLHFLERHGEDVDPDAPFTTSVGQHVMEGSWIGYGDPEPGFEPDHRVPMTNGAGQLVKKPKKPKVPGGRGAKNVPSNWEGFDAPAAKKPARPSAVKATNSAGGKTPAKSRGR